MKILVSGGTGFVGTAVTDILLALGHEVHTIGRSTPSFNNKSKNRYHHRFDLTKDNLPESLISGTEIFFHIAAKAGVWGSYSEFFSANVTATRKILTACQSYHIPKLIYTSTPSVVFSEKPIRNGTETLPYCKNEISPYAQTKSIAEKEVLKAHVPGKMQTIALRPHLVWGKGDPHLLPRVIQRHRAGKLKIVGDGTNQVDLTHIDNVAHAHICAMNSMLKNENLGGKPYFISQGEPVYLWDWLNQLFQRIDLPPLSQSLNFKTAFLVGSSLESIWSVLKIKKEPPMTRFVACQLAHDHWFSTKSAEADLSYKPVIKMNQAMEETLPWLQSL
jgi:nucleoside-diphosphate-sugar epimerase